MFEEGITHSVVCVGGPTRILEISSDVNLPGDTEDLVPQFDILCSAAENEALRNVPDVDLMNEVAAMGLRTYMVEVESMRRADIRAKFFLKMLEKYRCYRNKCREMHERLRENPGARSLGEELEKRDLQLMEAIRKNSVLEEQLRMKDEELEVERGWLQSVTICRGG
uniref:Uncharacterized protein LOC104245441 n=1 Tax=Nicotiana sylvestris TaxID=4096 RepID=A0A1U7YKJ9_NICSY|nr:PREDICTED: uncharacterized protein LOC104245441 [Nicotiana sylvestris]